MEKIPMSPIEENDEEGGVAVEDDEKERFEKLAEIAKWLEESRTIDKNNKRVEDPNAQGVILDELTEEDLKIFTEFQEGTLTEKELKDHNERVKEEIKKNQKDSGREDATDWEKYLNNSRASFGALLRGKMMKKATMARLEELGVKSKLNEPGI